MRRLILCNRQSPGDITMVTVGFFTYLAGTFVHRRRGTLHSVDLSRDNVAFARSWTAIFGNAVTVHQGDSVAFLQAFDQQIDVLYLDSLDTTEPPSVGVSPSASSTLIPSQFTQSVLNGIP